MSTFERDDYRWRETYFVSFESARRPTTGQMAAALEELSARYELVNLVGSEQGLFESVTVRSPSDHAALDISYASGGDVIEECRGLVDELLPLAADEEEAARIRRLPELEGRFDVLHFEQVVADDEAGEMLDPSALLIVIDALTQLTGGVGIDPQSGTLM